MSNTDPEAVPKEKKTRKATSNAPSMPDSNRDTTPTQESFSITSTTNAPTQPQNNPTLPLVTPLPPSSEDSDESTPSPMDTTTAHKPSNTKQLNALGRIPKKTIKLQGEILKGVLTLDNGLKLTSTPSGGFPVPQLGESVWRNVPPSLQAKWTQKPGAKAWARLYRAKYEENAQATVAKLRRVITQLIGGVRATDMIISPPTADETLFERYAQPWHLLISSIPIEAIELLTTLAVCATAEVTCFFVPFEQPLPTYICTIENLTFQDSARSNLLIGQLNIYCDAPPPFSLEDYYLWSALIRGLRFPSNGYSTGVPRLQEKKFTCTGCKSLDHPTGLCPLPATPGWLGPSNVANKEDLSMTTLDTRTNNSGSPGGQKRGANRGRGTRGRGNNGPRGGRGGPNYRGFKP
ncbi:hypothetical protein P692DRAFT_20820729 [Suillus brevipes Sb2]|nr:hypothetical protein P692DRAFT_20820729 [Suillus brevipes Sb2]